MMGKKFCLAAMADSPSLTGRNFQGLIMVKKSIRPLMV
jgi:hypothetical protein